MRCKYRLSVCQEMMTISLSSDLFVFLNDRLCPSVKAAQYQIFYFLLLDFAKERSTLLNQPNQLSLLRLHLSRLFLDVLV